MFHKARWLSLALLLGSTQLAIAQVAAARAGEPIGSAAASDTQAQTGDKSDADKSNRWHAAKLGVDEKMVRIARDKSTAEHSAVGPRVGRDGKVRRMPVRTATRLTDVGSARYPMTLGACACVVSSRAPSGGGQTWAASYFLPSRPVR